MRLVGSLSWIAAPLLALLALGVSSQAADVAEPTLPTMATSEEVVWLTRIDLTAFDNAALRAAAEAVLGRQAAMVDAPIKEIESRLGKMRALGVEVLLRATAYGQPDDELPVSQLTILHLGEGVDQQKVEQQAVAAMYGPALAAEFATRWDGNWLTIYPRAGPPREEQKPGARAALFEAALKSLGKRHGTLLVPNDRIRELDKEGRSNMPSDPNLPKIAQSVNDQIMNCRWASMAVKLDAEPALKLTIEAANEKSALKLLTDFKQLQQDLKSAGGPPSSGDYAVLAAGLTTTPPKLKNSRLVCVLDTKATAGVIAETVVAPLERAKQAAREHQSASQMKLILLGIIRFEADKGVLPDALEDLKPYLIVDEATREEQFTRLLTNPVNGASPGYVYTKPGKRTRDLKDGGAKTVVLEELKGGRPDPDGHRGFLDGRVDSKDSRKE